MNFALFCIVNVLSKFQGPGATSGLKIRFYNFEGLIILSMYNFGPMSTLIGQLLQFWLHSKPYLLWHLHRYRVVHPVFLAILIDMYLVGNPAVFLLQRVPKVDFLLATSWVPSRWTLEKLVVVGRAPLLNNLGFSRKPENILAWKAIYLTFVTKRVIKVTRYRK